MCAGEEERSFRGVWTFLLRFDCALARYRAGAFAVGRDRTGPPRR